MMEQNRMSTEEELRRAEERKKVMGLTSGERVMLRAFFHKDREHTIERLLEVYTMFKDTENTELIESTLDKVQNSDEAEFERARELIPLVEEDLEWLDDYDDDDYEYVEHDGWETEEQ